MAYPDFGITDGSAEFRLDLIQRATQYLGRSADWPMAAAVMLAAGWDSAALAELAGEGRRTDPVLLSDLVDEVVTELGMRVPDGFEAVWCATLIQCSRAADGFITPKCAADTVVDMTMGRDDPAMWDLMVEFAQGFEWNDAIEFRPSIEARWRDIVRKYSDAYSATIGDAILLATTTKTL